MKNNSIQVHKRNTFIENLRELWGRRDLIWVWTKFNIHANYIDKELGLVWIFLNPLFTSAVYSLVFGDFLGVREPRGGVPFICFYLSGIVVWHLFQDNVAGSNRIILSDLNLMTQVRYPREISVLVSFLEQIVSFLAAFVVMMIVLIANGYLPNNNYVYIPIIILIESLMIIGLMFFFSSMGVFIRDIGEILQPIVRIFFFMSGVIFPIENVQGVIRDILLVNPMFTIIDSFRRIVLYDKPPDFQLLGIFFIVASIILVTGYSYYKKKDATFVDHL